MNLRQISNKHNYSIKSSESLGLDLSFSLLGERLGLPGEQVLPVFIELQLGDHTV